MGNKNGRSERDTIVARVSYLSVPNFLINNIIGQSTTWLVEDHDWEYPHGERVFRTPTLRVYSHFNSSRPEPMIFIRAYFTTQNHSQTVTTLWVAVPIG